MTDLIGEIDDELRRERWQAMARQYGPWLGGALVVLLLAVGGIEAWRAHDASARTAATEQLLAALNADSPVAGAALLEKLTAPGQIEGLRLLLVAGAAAQQGDYPAALTALETLQAATDQPPLSRNLASLYWVMLQLDTGSLETLQPVLEPLLAAGELRYLAREQLALLQVRAGKLEDARTNFQQLLTDSTTPASIRERVAVLARLVADDAS